MSSTFKSTEGGVGYCRRMRLLNWAPLLTMALSLACSSADQSRSREFLALTYNVAGLPEGLSASHPSENMQYISPLLNDYDLVLTQEDWLNPNPNPFAGWLEVYHDVLAADAKHPYQSTPAPQPLGTDPTRPEALLSDGLNEFSRFEFHNLVRVRWQGCFGGLDQSDGGAGDCMATKGFFVATHVLEPGVEIEVIDLHGEAGSTAEDQRLSADDYRQLAEYIDQNLVGRAIVLGGDTNLHTEPDDPDAAVWQNFLADSSLSDVCSAVSCGTDGYMIDKFAFRSSASVRLEPLSHHFERDKFVHPVTGQPLSDHFALAVRWRWEASD